MQVTNIRVAFLREKQPVQFEKSRPEVEIMATLDDGEDHVAAIRRLMTEAMAVVYNGIGYNIPERVSRALATGVVPDGGTVETTTAKVEAEMVEDEKPVQAEAETDVPEAEEKTKPRRGRPPGSKSTKVAVVEAAVDIPDDDSDLIRTQPEDRVNPEEEVPEDKVPEGGITVQDLHGFIVDHTADGTLPRLAVKEMFASYRVARVRDIPAKDLDAAKKAMDEAIEVAAK